MNQMHKGEERSFDYVPMWNYHVRIQIRLSRLRGGERMRIE